MRLNIHIYATIDRYSFSLKTLDVRQLTYKHGIEKYDLLFHKPKFQSLTKF